MKKFKKLLLLTLIFILAYVPSFAYAGNGIDISNYQTGIPYSCLKGSGIEYCYIKASEGVTFRDYMALTHYEGCRTNNVKTGFYHFMKEDVSPTAQADYFYNIIKNYDYQLTPVLDIENNTQGRSAYQVSQRVREFCNEFEKLSGKKPIIYTGSYFERNYFTQDIINNYKMWIAQYYISTPTVAQGTQLVGFQYTDRYLFYGHYLDGDNFTSGIELNSSNSGVINSVQANSSNITQISSYTKYAAYIVNQGHTVAQIQGLLNNKGYNLNVDGDFGALTFTAITNFQTSNGLTADGYVGSQTYSKLIYTNNWTMQLQKMCGVNQDGIPGPITLSHLPVLRYGSSGSYVSMLQQRLNSYGFNCGKVDGNFGIKTKNALYCYQKNRGLQADSICGRNTWRKLML